MNKILLIDGHSILNRAFYGVPPLTNLRDSIQMQYMDLLILCSNHLRMSTRIILL